MAEQLAAAGGRAPPAAVGSAAPTLGGGSLVRDREAFAVRLRVRWVRMLAASAAREAERLATSGAVPHLVAPAVALGPSSGAAVDKRSECPF